MSQDRPTLDELLAVTHEFVASAASRLPVELRYRAQVAAYVLGIAEREVRHAAAHARRTNERMAALLGRPGTTAELNSVLCNAIRSGELDGNWVRVLESVLDVVVDKVSIVRPDRLDPMHAEAL